MRNLRLFAGSIVLLLSTGLAAGQSTPAPSLPGPSSQSKPFMLTLSSFAAAYDSLQLRVARIRTQTESLQTSFTATQGSFGGLHRKIKSYAGIPWSTIGATGEQTRTLVVRQQTVKYRYGIELETLVYRDGKGRNVMTERYEDHHLTRLELFEYGPLLSSATARWLLVRGDYLSYFASPVSLAYKGEQQQRVYFFRAPPAGK